MKNFGSCVEAERVNWGVDLYSTSWKGPFFRGVWRVLKQGRYTVHIITESIHDLQ